MPYRIRKSDDGVQKALRRIADEQIARAIAEIRDDGLDFAQKVHQARKRCKKLRGLLRLVRPSFDGYPDENRAFRDAARLLSGIRDTRTLIRTYDAVTGRFEDRIDRRAFAPIRARLTRDARGAREDPRTRERMRDVLGAMEAARGRAAKWKLDDDGFDALGGGLGRTYGRARERMQEAWSDRADGTMHEWRKRVKYHWHHARLLGGMVPAMTGPQADAAHALSGLLGDHHDLATLEARIGDAPRDFGPATDLDAFRALIRERKEALAEDALALGRTALAERKKALVKRWGGYWKVWRAGDAGPDLLVVKA